jgi:hypothetical protein
MRTLTIEASSAESARAFVDALAGFDVSLAESETGGYLVEVKVSGDDQEVVDLLDALEEHVTNRGHGPAQFEVEGHAYTLHPRPDSDPAG